MTSGVIKITDILQKKDKLNYSIEVLPTITSDKFDVLTVEPAFIAVTWHASSHESKSLDVPPLKVANYLRSKGKTVLLHLTCERMKKDYLTSVLAKLKENGICNLFVILGESYDSKTSDFKNSKELLIFIRESTADYFCIGVAGFPDSKDETLLQLKDKVDSGANFIITQAFLKCDQYINFVTRCEQIGIKVPVIPGIFLYENQEELMTFANMYEVKVPSSFQTIATNDKTANNGAVAVKKLITEIITSKPATKHFHFFSFNKLERYSKFIKESYDPKTSDFKNSKELIKYIRKSTEDYFCIGVAGFPDSSDETLLQLKDKIESGANFIITQAFFQCGQYINYVNRCEKIGITVPVIAGLFLYENQKEMMTFANMCGIKVSSSFEKRAISKEGVNSGREEVEKMITDIITCRPDIRHFHFFTLNKLDRFSTLFIKNK